MIKIKQGDIFKSSGSQKPVVCDNLEQWDGVGGGRDVQEGGDKCISNSYWSMEEANTIL